MKKNYTIPVVEILYLESDNNVCALSGNPNESFTEQDGGGFDY